MKLGTQWHIFSSNSFKNSEFHSCIIKNMPSPSPYKWFRLFFKDIYVSTFCFNWHLSGSFQILINLLLIYSHLLNILPRISYKVPDYGPVFQVICKINPDPKNWLFMLFIERIDHFALPMEGQASFLFKIKIYIPTTLHPIAWWSKTRVHQKETKVLRCRTLTKAFRKSYSCHPSVYPPTHVGLTDSLLKCPFNLLKNSRILVRFLSLVWFMNSSLSSQVPAIAHNS